MTDFNWVRYWYPIGFPPLLDRGYLYRPHSQLEAADQGKALVSLRDAQCVVLLGAPGMGKTREVYKEAKALTEVGQNVSIIEVGRQASAADRFGDILNSYQARTWRDQPDQMWHLFLDGLDEANATDEEFIQNLDSFFEGLAQGPISNLRLRITCRTAEWPAALDSILSNIWSPTNIVKSELAPLQQLDVFSAMAQRHGDETANRFVTAIDAKDVEPLAARPVSLFMLMSVFDQNFELPERQIDLYRAGLSALLDEHDKNRAVRPRAGANDPQSRLVVAARLAACMTYGGAPLLSVSSMNEQAERGVVPIHTAAGGSEPSNGASFPVDEFDLMEVVRSPLMTSARTDTYVWSHQTFAEFLAAYYLDAHELSADDILQLCSVAPRGGANAGIAPQLREVAAWAASLNPHVFRLLVDREPDILIQSDVAAASLSDRKALVEALLAKQNTSDLFDSSLTYQRLAKLNAPGLDTVIIPYLRDKSKSPAARHLAIDIAAANRITAAAENLTALANDPTEDAALRRSAVDAVRRIGSLADCAGFVSILEADLSFDSRDELKGAALRATWPAHLTFETLLRYINPSKNTSWFGSYSSFLTEAEIPPLTIEEALHGAQWLARIVPDVSGTQFDSTLLRFAPKVFKRVIEQHKDKRVLDVLAPLITGTGQRLLYGIFENDADALDVWPLASSERVELVLALITRAESPLTYSRSLSFSARGLIKPMDLEGFIRAIERDERHRHDGVYELIGMLSRNRAIEEQDFVWEAAEKIPAFGAILREYYYMPLDSANVKWLREDARKKAAKKSEEARPIHPSGRELVAKALERIDGGDIDHWWRLDLHMCVDQQGSFHEKHEHYGDLTIAPAWQRLSDDQRTHVVQTARKYLESSKVRYLRSIRQNSRSRIASAGYRALRLLWASDPISFESLSSRTWTRWIPAALTFFENNTAQSDHAQAAIIAEGYKRAPEALIASLKRFCKHADVILSSRTADLLADAYDEDLGRTLYEILEGNDFGDTELARAFSVLLVEREFSPAIRDTTAIISEARDGDVLSARVIGSFVALMQVRPDFAWGFLTRLHPQSPKITRDLWRAYASNAELRRHASFATLPPNELASVYEQLTQLFPPPAEPQSEQSINASYEIGHLKRHILSSIAETGTEASVLAIERLNSSLGSHEMRFHLRAANAKLRANSWKALSPQALIERIATLRPLAPRRNEVAAALQTLSEKHVIVDVPTEDVALNETPRSPSVADSLRLLLVATEWKSKNGGLSTLNRELCCALAAAGHKVGCVVLDADADDTRTAADIGVRLFEPPKRAGIIGTHRILLFTKKNFADFLPDVVIGHDHVTGSQAAHLAQSVFEKPYVHFLHTLPEEAENAKGTATSVLYGDRKRTEQLELCSLSSLVVAVGPRIHSEICLTHEASPIHELLPGLNGRLIRHQSNVALKKNICLLTGRVEDARLKGVSIGCRTIKRVCTDRVWDAGSRPRLIVRGFDPQTANEQIRALANGDEYSDFVLPRAFSTNVDDIERDLKAASLVIMPSRCEGFGLVGLEAIAAGIPSILSGESGLGQYLVRAASFGVLPKEIVTKCVADAAGHPDDDIVENWAALVGDKLSSKAESFRDAEIVRNALLPILTWANAISALLNAIKEVR